MLSHATFALGCFWCPDAQFGSLRGVVRTRVGYCGGTRPTSPTYKNLGNHSECVQIDFHSHRITYGELLDAFWRWHDPISQYGEGQYASAIFYHTDEQRQQAEESKTKQERLYARPLPTRIDKMNKFTRAEEYHQKVRFFHRDVREVICSLLALSQTRCSLQISRFQRNDNHQTKWISRWLWYTPTIRRGERFILTRYQTGGTHSRTYSSMNILQLYLSYEMISEW